MKTYLAYIVNHQINLSKTRRRRKRRRRRKERPRNRWIELRWVRVQLFWMVVSCNIVTKCVISNLDLTVQIPAWIMSHPHQSTIRCTESYMQIFWLQDILQRCHLLKESEAMLKRPHLALQHMDLQKNPSTSKRQWCPHMYIYISICLSIYLSTYLSI